MGVHKPIWMVVRDSVQGRITFGPFATREEAQTFVDEGTHGLFHGGFVVDAAVVNRSYCGPWIL